MPAPERLYYLDSELTSFDAQVMSCEPLGDRWAVGLDRSAFYPTSGGQPFDTGRLGGVDVVDVQDDDERGVVHVVGSPLGVGENVRGEVDRARRLDHMQQHTGQHVLSAAFDRLFGVRTVSFHMGAETSTIDLAREVTAREIAAAEDEANRVVWDDRPVNVRFVNEEEARALPLRKESARTGTLRLVEIPEFDLSACGGTHVSRTGAIGVIAVSGAERFKGATRLIFVCGRRALLSHRTLRDAVGAAARTLSIAPLDVPAAVERLQIELKEAGKSMRKLEEAIAVYRGVELRRAAEPVGRHLAVLRNEPDFDAAGLKGLAVAIVAGSGVVAALVGGGTPAAVVIARGQEADVDASALIKGLTASLGGRGGGSRDIAQGGVPATAGQILEQVRIALSQ
jgi:alanyl-tRNA synthetase